MGRGVWGGWMWGPFPELSLGGCPSPCDSSGDSDSDTGPRRLRTTLRFGGKKRRFWSIGAARRLGTRRCPFGQPALSRDGGDGLSAELGDGTRGHRGHRGDKGDTEGTRGSQQSPPQGLTTLSTPGFGSVVPVARLEQRPLALRKDVATINGPVATVGATPGQKKKKKGGQPTPHRFGRDLGTGWEV